MAQPDIRSILHRKFLTKTLKELQPKEPPVTVGESTTVSQAIAALQRHKIGCVVVLGADKRVKGIFTERDIITKVIPRNIDIMTTRISEVMTPNPETMRMNASIARAIYSLTAGDFRHLPIVTSDPSKLWIISIKDIVDYIYRALTKRLVSSESEMIVDDTPVDNFFESLVEILEPHPPITAAESTKIVEVMQKLKENNVGCVVIKSSQKKIGGIFTERDYLTKIALEEVDIHSATVGSFMTHRPQTAQLTTSISYVFNMFSQGGYRHIPVVNEDEELCGILSVKNFFSYLSKTIVDELA